MKRSVLSTLAIRRVGFTRGRCRPRAGARLDRLRAGQPAQDDRSGPVRHRRRARSRDDEDSRARDDYDRRLTRDGSRRPQCVADDGFVGARRWDERVVGQDGRANARDDLPARARSRTAQARHRIYRDVADEFAGSVRSEIHRSKTGKPTEMLATQMESTDARRLFPSWDEPVFRAKFHLSATLPKAWTAVSNMPLASSADVGTNARRVTFETTPAMPRISSFCARATSIGCKAPPARRRSTCTARRARVRSSPTRSRRSSGWCPILKTITA